MTSNSFSNVAGILQRPFHMQRFILILFCFVFLGCDAIKPDLSIKHYERTALTFSHFGHWRITEDGEADGVRFFTLEGPSDLLILGQVYQQQDAVMLDDYVLWYTETFAEELPIGKVVDVRYSELERQVDQLTLSGVREDFVLELLGQKLPFSREYLALEQADKTLYLVYQSENGDYAKGQEAFQLLLRSIQF